MRGLRDRESLAHGAWDWSTLFEGLPFCAGNLDGLYVLRNGYALGLEAKRASPLAPPHVGTAQWLALRTLADCGNFEVLLLGGDPSKSEFYWIRKLSPGFDSGWLRTTTDVVRSEVRIWYETHRDLPPFWKTRARGENENWTD